MIEAFTDTPEAVENTVKIAERCNVELDFSANYAPVVNPVFGARLRKLLDDGAEPAQVPTRFESDEAVGSNRWLKDFCAQVVVEPVKEDAQTDGVKRGDGNPRALDRDELEAHCDLALRLLCEAGLVWRYGTKGITPAIRERLERELQILADKKISAYFIIV